ncbi:MAG: hypothetical protein EOO06_06270 [Chitinophagaceae bacterium]|nr:MAG: hypothetical protein EOO06_06270 [Chitinophagaceae bacterium]
MRKILASFCTALLLFAATAAAQSLRYNISMPYTGLGAYSSRQTDPFGFTGNQAALAKLESAGVGVWGERRFMLTETSVYGLAAGIPTRMGNFGVQLNYSGFSNFNDNKVGLAYARNLGKFLDLGVQFNYYGYRIPEYGSASAVNFEIGAIMHFSDKFNGGIHAYNPVGGKLGKLENEKLASAYKLGLGYDATDNFYISAEIVKEEDRSVNVIGGVQYQFMKKFFARAGFLSESGSAFGGAGVGWKNFRLDIAANYHPQLGFSPGILLIANFKQEKEK